MATEKVKKPRKPRKKKVDAGTETKPVSRRRKKTIENQVPTAGIAVETKSVSSKKAVENTARNLVSNAKVLFKDKIQLHELPTLTSIANTDAELTKISIDTSKASGSSISSLKTSLKQFSGLQGSNVRDLLDNSAAKRYHTETNELSARDLKIFSSYSQQGTKKVYFNDHPYVVNDIDINSLDVNQLLTKNNLDQAERYFVNRFLESKSVLKTYNWETDDTINYEPPGLADMLIYDTYDSQATYKFEWGNDKRTTNTVDLNIYASYYYSVIGIVSVKSILPDQKSGTIYLEAKPRDQDDADENWIVIDSAVFKFNQSSNKRVGTYVSLAGYMSPGYVSRLRLNLHPNAYSMNNWEYREKGSISNHYSNTFVGTAYILDDFLPGDTIEIPFSIKFTDRNYRVYKYSKTDNILTADLSSDYKERFGDSQTITVQVSDVISKIKAHIPSIEYLDISTQTQTGRSQFKINGLRYSPTGKIYPSNTAMNLYSNCVLYPSYSSGTITVSSLGTATYNLNKNSIGESWQSGRVLYNLDATKISALSGHDWPSNTEIYGNHRISGTMKQINSVTTRETYQYDSTDTAGPISFNNKVVTSHATYSPRVDNQLITLKIDFTNALKGFEVTGDITCYITATPSTYGGGSGNESWGRIRYGNTSESQLNNLDADSSTIVSPVQLSTKNITKWISNKLCTGSRWNVHEGTLKTHFTQSSKYKQIWIQACADTAHEDTKPTYFSVTADVKIYFKYKHSVSGSRTTTTQEEVTSTFNYVTTGTREQIVTGSNSKIYPILSSSQTVQATVDEGITNSFRVDNITATGRFNSTTLTVIPYPQDN